MNDFFAIYEPTSISFLVNFCGQKVNFKWRSYQADRPLVCSSVCCFIAMYVSISLLLFLGMSKVETPPLRQ